MTDTTPLDDSKELDTLAKVNGLAVVELPQDLYIPPDAMKVLLETFEGPLDFLLYLIRKQNIDILNIPIASVTKQYMNYIDLMQELSLELASEYLVMAAILAEIKSRMLLPRPTLPEDEENDPRAELVKRLQEYERYKKAAADLDDIPRVDRDFSTIKISASEISIAKPLPKVQSQDLIYALFQVLKRAELNASHLIEKEQLSVREKMTLLLSLLENREHVLFSELFDLQEGRLGIVVTFLAMLELLKQGIIDFIQAESYAPIYLTKKSNT